MINDFLILVELPTTDLVVMNKSYLHVESYDSGLSSQVQ